MVSRKEVERWTSVLLIKIESDSKPDALVCTKFIRLDIAAMNYSALTRSSVH